MTYNHIALQSQARRVSAQFLLSETEVGLTFAAIALHSADQRRAAVTRELARTAYQAAVRYRGRVSLTDEEASEIGSRLSRLEDRLRQLGESL